MSAPAAPFKTSDLDAASYLRALNFPLLSIDRGTGRATFYFPPEAASVVTGFYSGGLVCAQDYANALRELKTALHTVPKNSNSSEATRHDPRPQ